MLFSNLSLELVEGGTHMTRWLSKYCSFSHFACWYLVITNHVFRRARHKYKFEEPLPSYSVVGSSSAFGISNQRILEAREHLLQSLRAQNKQGSILYCTSSFRTCTLPPRRTLFLLGLNLLCYVFLIDYGSLRLSG